MIVNETAAKMLRAGESALGHQFTLGTRMGQGGANVGGVVGVASDVRDFGPRVPVRPTVYLSHVPVRSLLFGAEPTDIAIHASVAAGLFVVALVACYLPARRASRIDPVTALRYE